MKNIDIKSVIIGMLATALAFACTAAKEPENLPRQGALIGKYQGFGATEGGLVLLDTTTGTMYGAKQVRFDPDNPDGWKGSIPWKVELDFK